MNTPFSFGALHAYLSKRSAWRFGQRHPWLVCLLGSAVWFGLTTGLRPLAIPDEGRYVGVAWEMLQRGDWSVPTLDGMPFFHKPPLFYWVTAAALEIFGPGVVAARAAPWLAAVAMTTGLFAFLKRWDGPQAARMTVLVLTTLPLFYGGSQYANLDLLVAACIGGAILLSVHAILSQEAGRAYRGAASGAFAVAALGVLSKGLIGVALPIGVLLPWAFLTKRGVRALGLLAWPPGWLIFWGVAAPWFVVMQLRFPGFLHYFFVVQQVERFRSSGFNNPQPFWFYGAVLAVLALPWSGWLLAGRGARSAMGPAHATARDLRWLMVIWLTVVTVFFSLPNSKLIGYILPALVPLACLIAARIPAGSRLAWQGTAGVAATICIAAAVIAHSGQPKSRAALAEVMRESRRADEPVVFIGNYYYDIAFYARMKTPPLVLDRWEPAELAKDSWRRELVDAEGFAPAGTPRTRLRNAELATLLCHSSAAWLVGSWPPSPEPSWLAGMPTRYRDDATALWRVDASDPAKRAVLGCDAPGGPVTP